MSNRSKWRHRRAQRLAEEAQAAFDFEVEQVNMHRYSDAQITEMDPWEYHSAFPVTAHLILGVGHVITEDRDRDGKILSVRLYRFGLGRDGELIGGAVGPLLPGGLEVMSGFDALAFHDALVGEQPNA